MSPGAIAGRPLAFSAGSVRARAAALCSAFSPTMRWRVAALPPPRSAARAVHHPRRPALLAVLLVGVLLAPAQCRCLSARRVAVRHHLLVLGHARRRGMLDVLLWVLLPPPGRGRLSAGGMPARLLARLVVGHQIPPSVDWRQPTPC